MAFLITTVARAFAVEDVVAGPLLREVAPRYAHVVVLFAAILQP